MKKTLHTLLLAIPLLFLAGCYTNQVQTENSESIKTFIIGRWEIYHQNDLSGIYYSSLDFVDADTLICSINDSHGTIYNNKYIYKFTGDNHLEISGNRTGDKWSLYRNGDTLVVKSYLNPSESMKFKRVAYFNWPIIALMLFGILVGMTFARMRGQQSLITEKNHEGNLWFNVINFIVFLIGLLLGVYISNLNFLLKITMPWDGIIILEICLFFLIAGVKTRKYFPFSRIGILLLGFCVWGIIASLARIILYLTFGYYPS